MKEVIYQLIYLNSKGFGLNTLFHNFQHFFGSIHEEPRVKEWFLSLMEEFMYKGYFKLYENDRALPGSIEEQIDFLRRKWPVYYNENEPRHDIDNLWWLIEAPNVFWIERNFEECQ
ncbi:DUF596 domain-containing protein [Pasteurella testudinis]|uniref:DUF596 domain-containing protein n=1 Tax=Pasteurella testudinis TaxID=761 RepID=UPI004058BA37